MNKQTMVIGIVVLLLVLGGVFVMSQQKSPTPESTEFFEENTGDETLEFDQNATDEALMKDSESTLSGSPTAMDSETEVQSFTIEGSSFKFSLPEIKVKQGDKVKVTFVNKGGTHDWVLEGYNVRTQVLSAGASETVEFTADKAGTFAYYCSVGEHRKLGMEGKLIVE